MMNNDAFRELFKQGGKSTKEIAREAVEDEFRLNTKKRKKRGGGGDSSDEEQNDDDDDDDNNKKHKKKHDKKRSSSKYGKDNDDNDDPTNSSSYRDRAQERREGKVDEREFATTDFQGSAEMSKYLGGDERHTHLVKGLDVTLARRVKREMGKLIDSPRSKNTKVNKKQLEDAQEQERMVETMSEAKQLIQDWSISSAVSDHKRASSQLGQSMLVFLQQRLEATAENNDTTVRKKQQRLQVSSAGRALQRSTLTFSSVSHPGDARRAWEVPEELTSMVDNSNNDNNSRDSWWNVSLLNQVQEVFTRSDKKMNQPILLPTMNGQKLNTSMKGATTEVSKRKENDDDSSDDDIFADAGDYVPTTTTSDAAVATGTISTSALRPSAATKSAAKASLFFGLPTNQQDEQDDKSVHEDGLTIVAKLAQKARASANPKSGDFSQYDGAYGDDGMDMDFSGQCEDDDDGETGNTKKKKKGSKVEESTMASREYGKRGKPQKEATYEE